MEGNLEQMFLALRKLRLGRGEVHVMREGKGEGVGGRTTMPA